ncbi:hypothetical protein T4D_4751 [Trichinella pseudospiralis]|uniref:Uncharacterized protein n=1 Tax=Trichinella pseudospiralis TaxID=6337 RepID=A0A0V1DPN5_TRIPS|nr:hypothetical protein T4D_4751 [Trichinella pseudospiralis]
MNMGKQPMCACAIEFFAESLPGPRHAYISSASSGAQGLSPTQSMLSQ